MGQGVGDVQVVLFLKVWLFTGQGLPPSTASLYTMYISGSLPSSAVWQGAWQGPAGSQVPLQATGLQGLGLVQAVTVLVAPSSSGQAEPL